ncbi:carbohydrate ABC transporter permease [Paenibacillus sp. HB172176]|uniref:carbohydrate ABC transporter permease n=1 Tax=Paenibacillus sp. HB172176 TaxID=2493690 RepID=UPI001F0E689B|nr:carbohydrate ABC transporter permease [Paenibacillus sp. HB172176]
MLVLFALVMLVPIVLTFTNSLMTEGEIEANYGVLGQMLDVTTGGRDQFVNLKLLPDWLSLGQYGEVLLFNSTFLRMFWNSAFMVAPIIAGQTVIAALSAYAFARLSFRGRDRLFLLYLISMLMPFQVTLVPNYIMSDKLGLLNTEGAVILPGIFSAFGVFMLRQFLLPIPGAYTEAAKIDGAGHFVIFTRLMLPLVMPGLASLTVLLFVDYWNMVEQPLIFLRDAVKQPLSLYLAHINQSERGVGFAASVLYMTPMILLYLYAESYFVQGVQQSGVKG